MRGITSGLQPRRYADGDLVEEDKGFFGGVMDFFKEYGPMASLPMAAYEYATDPEKAKERYTKEGLSKRNEQFKDYIFDYTDPIEYATLPLYLAGPAGAAANKGIKAARVANKIKKAGPAEKILDNKATKGILNIGGPVAGISADIAIDPEIDFGDVVDAGKYYGTQAVESVKNIFTNDAVDDAQEDVDKANKKETEKEDEKDENLTEEEKEKKSFLEKMGQVFEAYGASQGVGGAPKGIAGQMIRGTAINTPEITRYQNGGIADMMPQEPMMMADGGIAHFAFGGAAIKKAIKAGVEKGIGVFNKAKKSTAKETKKIKEERKVKPRSTKKSDSKDLVLYDEAAAKAAAPTRTRGYLDFLPAPIAGVGVAAGKGVGQAGRALYDLKKPLAPYGALAATGLGIATYANSGDPEPTAEEIAKAKKDAAQAKAKADLEERQAAREGLTALPEIRAARALERAEEAGRTEANFVDYVATFPASYTEKIGKDPEFAKQMMAGFIAMAKPTEGFVPRNAFVDFGEAAMAEGARQEGEVPDQIKLLEAIEGNPDLLKSMRKLNQKTSDPFTDAKNLSGLKEFILTDLYGKDNYDEDDVILDARTGAEISDLQLLQMYKDSGEDLNVVRSNIMPKAKV